MLALRAMATGGPLDVQRQQRWPAYVSTSGLGADLPGLDNNPELEDREGPNAENVIDSPDVDTAQVEKEEV